MAAPSSLLVSMLLGDARLPAAGHTQSGGLEPGLANGLSPDGVPGYCRTRLGTVTRTEAATAVVSRHECLRGASLEHVEQHWAARTPSDAMRASSRALGRGLLRLATQLWPESPDLQRARFRPDPCRAVVLGAVAAAADLPADDLARVVGYDDVQTVVAAALKLTPLDPAVAAAWAWQLLPDIDVLAGQVSALTDPATIPAGGAPEIERWAQLHAATSRRLFRA